MAGCEEGGVTVRELREWLAAFPDDVPVSVQVSEDEFAFVTSVIDVGAGRSVILITKRAGSDR